MGIVHCVHWALCTLCIVCTEHCVHWALCSLSIVFTVHCVHCALCAQCIVYTVHCVHWNALCAMCRVKSAVWGVKAEVFNAQSIIWVVEKLQCSLLRNIIQCSVHCSLCTAQRFPSRKENNASSKHCVCVCVRANIVFAKTLAAPTLLLEERWKAQGRFFWGNRFSMHVLLLD